jgi:hypothetical protein
MTGAVQEFPATSFKEYPRMQGTGNKSLRSVGAGHMDDPIFVVTSHVDAPWIAADLAILNEAAADVRLDVDFHLLAAKWTADHELVRHLR